MDIPDLVQRALDGEEIQAGVSLGDEDAVCLTPTRTLVYRGEGLLSDEQISEYAHDIEQLTVSEGRRKTKFTLQYIDGTDSFTVPANRGEKVLELFLEGVLRIEEVIESRESILGVYRFSELTVIIAEGRLIKHIGEPVWNEDYEVYDFEDVTGLDFERASVATSISLSVDGRPQRIKVPNDTAPVVRQTLEKALFEYYDVASLEELNRVVDDSTGGDAGEVDTAETADETDDFAFGDDFDPLVSDEDDEGLTEPVDADDPLAGGGASADTGESGASDVADSAATGENAAPTDAEPAREPESGAARPAEAESARPRGTESAGATEQSRTRTERSQTRTERSDELGGTDAADLDRSRTPQGGGRTESEAAGASEPSAASEATGAAEPTGAESAESAVTREEFEAVAERLDDLTEAVERQNELLRRQHRAIKQLARQREE